MSTNGTMVPVRSDKICKPDRNRLGVSILAGPGTEVMDMELLGFGDKSWSCFCQIGTHL